MATAVATQPAANGNAALPARRNLIQEWATRLGVDPAKMVASIKATAFKGTDDEFLAFMVVADQYKLNPFTREIFAFPKRGGGIQNVVSVDGWANIINSHPEMDGVEFVDQLNEGGELVAVTAKIFRKDRRHPTECTEYMAECKRGGDTPWATWPRRMLRHKALIQCARYAFGFSGIVDQDEAERGDVITTTATVTPVHAKAKPSAANALLSAPKQEQVEPDPVYAEFESQPVEQQPEPSGDSPMTADDMALASLDEMLEATDSILKIDGYREKYRTEFPAVAAAVDAACDARRDALTKNRGQRSNK